MKKYLPKYKRTETKNFNITQRDIKILLERYKHRFLTTPDIVKLLSAKNEAIIRNRLKLLYHSGHIQRIEQKIELQSGSKPLIYAIEDKGVKLLVFFGMIQEPEKIKFNWTENNRRIKSQLFLNHSLLLSEIFVEFQSACISIPNINFIEQSEVLKNASQQTQKQQKPYKGV